MTHHWDVFFGHRVCFPHDSGSDGLETGHRFRKGVSLQTATMGFFWSVTKEVIS